MVKNKPLLFTFQLYCVCTDEIRKYNILLCICSESETPVFFFFFFFFEYFLLWDYKLKGDPSWVSFAIDLNFALNPFLSFSNDVSKKRFSLL